MICAPALGYARDITHSKRVLVEGQAYDVHVYSDGSAWVLQTCTSIFFCFDTMDFNKKRQMRQAVKEITSCEIGEDFESGATLKVSLKCRFAQRAVLGIIEDNKLCDDVCESGAAQSQEGAPPTSLGAELERLEALLNRGAITREEFEVAKRKFLGLE